MILTGGGDGDLNKVYTTARTLLHEMNSREIYPLVCSFNTNRVPATADTAAMQGARDIADFFNSGINKDS